MDANKTRKVATNDTASVEPAKPTIRDEDVTVAAIDRRSFLSRVGARSAALAGVVVLAGSAAACGGSDQCDTDDGTDADPTDPAGRGRNDRCDTD